MALDFYAAKRCERPDTYYDEVACLPERGDEVFYRYEGQIESGFVLYVYPESLLVKDHRGVSAFIEGWKGRRFIRKGIHVDD